MLFQGGAKLPVPKATPICTKQKSRRRKSGASLVVQIHQEPEWRMHEPDSPQGSLFTAKGTEDRRPASLFWMQPQWVGLDRIPAGLVGQAMSKGAGLSESLCWDFAWFLGKSRGTEESQVSEHKRYPLEEPLVEQGRGAELWSAPSRNGSGKKWRRKSREMVMFT